MSHSPVQEQCVTPEQVYLQRRHFIKAALALLTSSTALASQTDASRFGRLTPYRLATSYNNFYEFTTNKEMVKHIAAELTIEPWTLQVGGLVDNPLSLSVADLQALGSVERVYPMRCVEGWSMVVPWSGVPLNRLLAKAKPKASAAYVKFVGTLRPEEMIGQRAATLPWPYTEGLRIDEAMHPLTLLATGLYAKPLPTQNGAPIRLVVPWKYGYKSIKTLQRIELVDSQPQTSWHTVAPNEYGFFANVNPDVPHPRWSQRLEVRLGEIRKIKTQPFNGFANEVASLYEGMDLVKHL